MSTHEDSTLLFELCFVVAIYFGFILSYLLFTGVFNIVFLQYLAISILTSATVLLFYKAYTKKQVIVFVLGFTIIGTLLFSMSTIITMSYVTTETYPSTKSSSWYNDTVTLDPLESRTINMFQYSSYNFFWLNANGTVLQLTFSNSGRLRVIVYYTKNWFESEELGLNESFGGNGQAIGSSWFNIYWAPVGPIDESWYSTAGRGDYYNQIAVGLENLENSSEQIILGVTYFDFTGTAQRNITNYRPLIDSEFGYLGIGLIITAMAIELATRRRRPLIKQSVTASA